jgi:hypothetical protein
MPGSSFILTLDTLGPAIEILAPLYTIPGVETVVWVTGSEPLALDHTVYTVDAAGVRRDLILEHLGDRLRLVSNFDGYALGTTRIYAQVLDEVRNRSALVLKTMNVLESARIRASLTTSIRPVILGGRPRSVAMATTARTLAMHTTGRHMALRDAGRSVKVSSKSRRIEVKDDAAD